MTDHTTSYQPVPGVFLSAAAAGIRYRGRDDPALIAFPAGARYAAVFTRNAWPYA